MLSYRQTLDDHAHDPERLRQGSAVLHDGDRPEGRLGEVADEGDDVEDVYSRRTWRPRDARPRAHRRGRGDRGDRGGGRPVSSEDRRRSRLPRRPGARAGGARASAPPPRRRSRNPRWRSPSRPDRARTRSRHPAGGGGDRGPGPQRRRRRAGRRRRRAHRPTPSGRQRTGRGLTWHPKLASFMPADRRISDSKRSEATGGHRMAWDREEGRVDQDEGPAPLTDIALKSGDRPTDLVLAELLRDRGWKVLASPSMDDAIDACRASAHSLCVLDESGLEQLPIEALPVVVRPATVIALDGPGVSPGGGLERVCTEFGGCSTASATVPCMDGQGYSGLAELFDASGNSINTGSTFGTCQHCGTAQAASLEGTCDEGLAEALTR